MRITLANLRRDLSRLDPDTVRYLQEALPYGALSRDEPLSAKAVMHQLYLAEALSRVVPR